MPAYVGNPKFDSEVFQVLQRYNQLLLRVTILEEVLRLAFLPEPESPRHTPLSLTGTEREPPRRRCLPARFRVPRQAYDLQGPRGFDSTPVGDLPELRRLKRNVQGKGTPTPSR